MSKVYIYESCSPLATFASKNSQVIQSEKVEFTNLPNTIFKDGDGNCWNYFGEYDNGYISLDNVFPINYSGNYFTNVVDIVYPDCNSCLLTRTSPCVITYFSATRCDSGTTEYVKVCNVGPISGPTKLLPTVQQVVGIKNPSGDDFCVTLNSVISEVDTDYEIATPAWETYDCDTCPIYKTYIGDSCDGSVIGLKIYAPATSTTLSATTSVSLVTNNTCYVITSYEGIEVEYNYESGVTPTVWQTFLNCNNCLIDYYNTQ